MKLKRKTLLSPKTFNYLYSIGAAVVILGSLFKLLHLPGADLMLIIGMGTEAFIFFMSAFDEPSKEPNWDNIYPGIYDTDLTAEEKAELAARHESTAGVPGATTIIGGGVVSGSETLAGGGTLVLGSMNVGTTDGPAPTVTGGSLNLTADQADQVAVATEKYVRQLNEINASLEKLSLAMSGVGADDTYAQQIAQLNRNIQGLNTMYEIQLKSVSSQLTTIEEVNRGLNNIRSLYENGQNDSYRIRQESDQLARNLQQLNEVYARMLQAMTVGKTL
ncbi:MAG: gliding motility protein GldL [Bacteroidales bacterium]|nr:gliding motility protein GldL [Candidatus Liminaster caballi]